MADKKEKMTRAYMMEPEAATMFYLLVKFSTDHKVPDSEGLRNSILDWMARNGMMKTVFDTKRSKDQIVQDYRKKGLTVDDRRIQHDARPKDNSRGVVSRLQRALERVVKFFTMGNSD